MEHEEHANTIEQAWQSLKHLPTLGKSLHASLAQYANGSLLSSLLLASLAIVLCHTAPLSIIQVPLNFGSKPACELLWSTSPILLIAQCWTARLYNEVSWGSTECKHCYYRSRMVGVDVCWWSIRLLHSVPGKNSLGLHGLEMFNSSRHVWIVGPLQSCIQASVWLKFPLARKHQQGLLLTRHKLAQSLYHLNPSESTVISRDTGVRVLLLNACFRFSIAMTSLHQCILAGEYLCVCACKSVEDYPSRYVHVHV